MIKRLKNERGMSLIEILVVLGIISVVVGGTIAALGGGMKSANKDIATTEINKMATYLKMYKSKNGKYPTTDEGLQALVEAGYYDSIPKDPWGNEYVYEQPGSHGKFDLYSLGDDVDNDADDVTSWNKEETE